MMHKSIKAAYHDPGEGVYLIPADEKARLPGPQRRAIGYIQSYLAVAQKEARNGYGEGVERCIGGAVDGASQVLEQNFLSNPADFLKNVIAEADKISGYVSIMPDYIAKKEILKDFKRLSIMSEQVAQQHHDAPEPVGMR